MSTTTTNNLPDIISGLEDVLSNPGKIGESLRTGPSRRIKPKLSAIHCKMLSTSQIAYGLVSGRVPTTSDMVRRAIELLAERAIASLKDPAVAASESAAVAAVTDTGSVADE